MEFIDIVFDGPPGHESGRFVEVEDGHGHSINAGEWLERVDGLWVLRIPAKLFNRHVEEVSPMPAPNPDYQETIG
jgi:hypothetical protein